MIFFLFYLYWKGEYEKKMTIAFSFQPDEKAQKFITQCRYHYDRNLLKINMPYLCVVGPQKMRVNPKRVIPHVEHTMRKSKATRIQLHTAKYIQVGEYYDVYIAVKNEEDLLPYRHQLYETALFGSLPDESFFPHIRIAHQIEEENAQRIVEELNNSRIHHSFIVRDLVFCVRQQESEWEEQYVIQL